MKAHIPAFAHPAFVEFVSAHAAKGDEDAARLLAKLPGKRRAKGLDLPGKSRKTRREERNERAAKIREAVMLRAGERCEWCGAAGMILELHHVFSGTGWRQAEERVETCAGICADCHRQLHRGIPFALANAKDWAIRLGFKDALGAIEKRLAKYREASRAAGGTRG